jgi:hypothetical protein
MSWRPWPRRHPRSGSSGSPTVASRRRGTLPWARRRQTPIWWRSWMATTCRRRRFACARAMLEADPALQLILSKVRFFDRADAAKLAPCVGSHTVDGRVLHLGASLYRRQLLDQVGPFDESLLQAEDIDFLLRTIELGPKYALSDEVGVYYRKNHGSITENRPQYRQGLMKALSRARKRQARPGPLHLPEGLVTTARSRQSSAPGRSGCWSACRARQEQRRLRMVTRATDGLVPAGLCVVALREPARAPTRPLWCAHYQPGAHRPRPLHRAACGGAGLGFHWPAQSPARPDPTCPPAPPHRSSSAGRSG